MYIFGVAVFLLTLFAVNTTLFRNSANVCFVDVGQANASFVAFDEQAVVFDCGGNYYALDNQLKFNGVKKIKLLALTHTDLDHCSSLEKLIDSYAIEQIVYPEFSKVESIKGYISNINTTAISKDTVFKINDFITVETFVEKAYNVKYYSNVSAAYKLNVYNNSVLYTGDMNIYQEHSYLDYGKKLDCDILSVAHHGSAKSSHTDFLQLCSPEFSVISVGKNNNFDLPSARIVDRLNKMSTVLQTSINSNINFKFTPKGYKCQNEY